MTTSYSPPAASSASNWRCDMQKPHVLLVERRAVRDEVGLVRQSEDVPLQLGERQPLPDGAL